MGESNATTAEVEFNDGRTLRSLTGPTGHLKRLGEHLGVEVGSRGNIVHLSGDAPLVALAERFFRQMGELADEGVHLVTQDHLRALHALQRNGSMHLRDIFSEVVLVTARQRPIKARGLAQREYVRAIHSHDLVRGIVLVGENGRKLPAGGEGRHVLEGGGVANDLAVDENSYSAGEGIYFLDDGGRHTIADFGQKAAAALGRKALTVATPRAVIWMSAVAAETVGRFTGRAPALNRDKVTASFATGWWCDATRARDEIGYQVEMPLELGLAQWVEWLRENKVL